ncbi:MAG TPA: hypothetical protein VFW75_17575 [Acetobacteraceae bacterium]|nr:hypothetical protein [Acetobacteraceae bacterium]
MVRSALAPAAAAVALLIVGFWRGWIVLPDPGAELQREISWQIDYQEAAMCEKFGFNAGTDRYFSCKRDLLDLRHQNELLQAATVF